MVSFALHLSSNVRKRTFGHVRTLKLHISLYMNAVWSESTERILDTQ